MTSVPQVKDSRSQTMRRDIIAAYVSAGARVGSWAIVSAIVYRLASPDDFAMLALIRGTIGILNYTSVGLTPALIRLFAHVGQTVQPSPPSAGEREPEQTTERDVYATGIFVGTLSAVLGLLIAFLYARYFDHLHVVPPSLARQAPWAVIFIGIGTLFRLFSDTSGSLLQVRGRIALTNYLLAASDICFALLPMLLFRWPGLLTAAISYAVSGLVLVVTRFIAAARLKESPWPPVASSVRWDLARELLSFGSLVLLGNLAEYFYAPTDYILINHFFTDMEVAAYAPGVQIDLGLQMLVAGVASVLLSKSAIAHAAGEKHSLRLYYIRGTLGSAALLAFAALLVWLLANPIFHLWFGANPPNTKPILHLVLIGTVVGGSSAVGRSVLLGMGKIKPFTAAALIAGLVNVIASYCFVKFGHLGLPGILYGTLLVVIGRCGIWMPWYVMRVLKVKG